MSSDDSDDDKPLASTLVKKEPEVGGDEDSDDSDDDEPISHSIKKEKAAEEPSKRKRPESGSMKEDDDEDDMDTDDDSDDDKPICQLVKAPSSKKRKPAAPAAKAKPVKKEKKASAKSPSKSHKKIDWDNSELDTSMFCEKFYKDCAKGFLIQEILTRWKYCEELQWPKPVSEDQRPGPQYKELSGFAGVYICIEGKEIGKVVDLRDPKGRPCFDVLQEHDSEYLQNLLTSALAKQMDDLTKQEGKQSDDTSKQLKKLLGTVKKVKPKTADKEAKKFIKDHA